MRALLVLVVLSLMGSMPARAEPKVAIFDFELLDTSLEGEMRGPQADEHARLIHISDLVRTQLKDSGKFELLDVSTLR